MDLDCPHVNDAIQIGLNAFALKLVAESWPHVLKAFATLELPLDSRVVLVLEAKDEARTRVRITLETTTDEPTPGQGAL